MKLITRNIQRVKAELRYNYMICLIPIGAAFIGHILDKKEDERMSKFRDKSALYIRDVPPKKPSW